MAKPAETIHAAKARRRRFILKAAAAAALLAVLAYVFVFSRHGYLRRRELLHENERLHTELEGLREENTLLREELGQLDDPEAMEKLAREKLGLVKDGEKVYRFVEKDEAPANPEGNPPPDNKDDAP